MAVSDPDGVFSAPTKCDREHTSTLTHAGYTVVLSVDCFTLKINDQHLLFFLQSYCQGFSTLLMILWYLMHWHASLFVNLLPAAISCMSSIAVMESLVIFLVENISTKHIIRKQMLDNFYINLQQSNFYDAFKAFYPRIYLLKQIFHATEDLDTFPVPEFSTDFSPYSGWILSS